MPVGIPLPLSIMEIELSVWIVTVISEQCPANASSIELSSTSKTRWCNPVPSEVSPIYIPGRFLTASKPSNIWIDDALYKSVTDWFSFVICSSFIKYASAWRHT